MTPKEKAADLFYNYHQLLRQMQLKASSIAGFNKAAKQCALIAVDELISAAWFSSSDDMEEPYRYAQKQYWQQVKQEIEKL